MRTDWAMAGLQDLDGVNVPLANGWNLTGNANSFRGSLENLRVSSNGTEYDWLTAAQRVLSRIMCTPASPPSAPMSTPRICSPGSATSTAGFAVLYGKPQPPRSQAAGPLLMFHRPEWELASGAAFLRDLVNLQDEFAS
jgi:hypothetical protein